MCLPDTGVPNGTCVMTGWKDNNGKCANCIAVSFDTTSVLVFGHVTVDMTSVLVFGPVTVDMTSVLVFGPVTVDLTSVLVFGQFLSPL